MERYDQLLYWVKERHRIKKVKEAGQQPPYTLDPVLQNYRFTNVHREDDTVTKWIHKHWCRPNQHDRDLWFAILVSRLINLPETLQELGFMSHWDNEHFIKVLRSRKNRGLRIYNGAYMLATHKHKMDKTDYYAWRLENIYGHRDNIRPRSGDKLQYFYDRLIIHDGFSSFMVSQVIADIKHYEPLTQATDWWSFAQPGPGSLRGMRRLYGQQPTDTSRDKQWSNRMETYRVILNKDLNGLGIKEVCAQNAQNILCEFDKYMRALSGEGRPKQKYNGG